MKFEVTAKAVRRGTGAHVGGPRAELVDTSDPLFAECKTEADVKEVYEAFWDLNPTSPDVVKVLGVKRVT